jgi:hypothetical protein
MDYKIQRLSLYTQRKLPNIGMLSYPGLVSLQPNSDGYSLSDATLTAHGPTRGVAEPLSAELACEDLLRLVEDSTWLL